MEISQTLLDHISDAVIELQDEIVSAFNRKGRMWFPDLIAGQRLPEQLLQLAKVPFETGSVYIQNRKYFFSRVVSEKQVLLVLRIENAALSAEQIEGVLRSLREQMGEMLSSLHLLSERLNDDAWEYLAAVNRRLYQMVRLVENADFLHNNKHGLHPAAVDMAAVDMVALCRQLCLEIEPLLAQIQVTIQLTTDCTSLLILGDPFLLRRMLLGLISNSARAAKNGGITLQLTRQRDVARLVIIDSGHVSESRPLHLLYSGERGTALPAPGEGAGLGISLVNEIAQLHGGALLMGRGQAGGLEATISIPIRAPSRNPSVESRRVEHTAGLSPLLVELSDVLPVSAYRHIDLES